MGVATMDSFLKALLSANDCSGVVVVDNAKFHPESWSEMPRRLRNNLTLKNDVVDTPPLTRRKKKPQRCYSDSQRMENPCKGRWGGGVQQKEQLESCDPAPPAPPQRQRSIGDPKKQQEVHVPAPPACPQRQKSIEVTPLNWTSGKSSPSSVLESVVEEGPRMPKRQASVALDSTDCLPPPPMAMAPPSRSKSSDDAVLLNPFVKRSSCSLLDDDDDDDESDSEEDVQRNIALLNISTQSF